MNDRDGLAADAGVDVSCRQIVFLEKVALGCETGEGPQALSEWSRPDPCGPTDTELGLGAATLVMHASGQPQRDSESPDSELPPA